MHPLAQLSAGLRYENRAEQVRHTSLLREHDGSMHRNDVERENDGREKNGDVSLAEWRTTRL